MKSFLLTSDGKPEYWFRLKVVKTAAYAEPCSLLGLSKMVDFSLAFLSVCFKDCIFRLLFSTDKCLESHCHIETVLHGIVS